MTFKKQITAVFLLMCILFTPALTSSATAHDYDHVYNDVTIITPDSFEEVFNETEVDRAAYTYELLDISNLRAIVAMEIELKIGHDYYTTVVSGTVNAYILPSGDKLYEGPIDGNMMIGEDEYKIIVGFSKLESDTSSFISMTIQDKSGVLAISFGNNIIAGEVEDYFLKKTEKSKQADNDNEMIDNSLSEGFATDFNENVSNINSLDPPGFFPLNPPELEYPNLGVDGTYVYQGNAFHMWNTVYSGSQSLVYWDETRNFMMVFVKPFVYHTQEFAKTLQFDVTNTTLESLEISLSLEPDATSSKLAHISSVYIPNDISIDILGGKYVSNTYFRTLLEALLNEAGVNLELIGDLLQEIGGNVTFSTPNDYSYSVLVNAGINAHLFEELDPGFPVRFDLLKNSHTYYVGDTEYAVRTKVRYLVTGYTRILGQEDQVSYIYIDSETSQTTYTITLS